MKRLLCIVSAGVILCGCRVEKVEPAAAPPAKAPAAAAAPAAPSVAEQAINGITGKTAVDAGQRAKGNIDKVNAIQQKRIDDTGAE